MKSFASVIAFSAAVAGFVAAQPSVQSRTSCKDTQFFWGDRSCCLEHGGPQNPPKPPRSRDCPSNGWYWDNHQGCCVPRHPSPPEPTCNNGYSWSHGTSCCEENPTATSSTPAHPSQTPPGYGGGYGNGNNGGNYGNNGGSYGGNGGNYGGNGGNYGGNDGNYGGNQGGYGRGGHKHKRHQTKRNDTLCARGYTACPVDGSKGLTTNDYECLDALQELRACGGCPSLGQGQDCTSIPHAKGVSCVSGTCQVSSCSGGFAPTSDGKSCY
ncbi:choline transport protein [Ceratobasidium sp. AG-Ba]|nr:choline transport protein [Ceratobasidium sp. AG-Ba]